MMGPPIREKFKKGINPFHFRFIETLKNMGNHSYDTFKTILTRMNHVLLWLVQECCKVDLVDKFLINGVMMKKMELLLLDIVLKIHLLR
jgi:hypothetical protein